MHLDKKITYIAFAAGVAIAILVLAIPSWRSALLAIAGVGYLAPFMAGTMYANVVTSPLSAVMFFELPVSVNPIGAAILGGIGSASYDLIIYRLLGRASHVSIVEHFTAWLNHNRYRTWASVILGGIVIASPLPDELGIAMIGFSKMSTRWFLLLSFALNTAGILAITLIGRSIHQ
ncbi:MAG: hypothetical protein HYY50_04825 [Candidatus Kerfeldbacteria bacterium]|nr:hypothetical protein [Candidatus Kerfeldbacteria bacterium]